MEGYIPKDIPPLEPMNIPNDVKKKLEGLKKEMDSFKKDVIKKFDKYIIGISLLPPPKDKDAKKDEIHIFVLVDDSDSKRMAKEELRTRLTKIIEEMATKINKNFIPEVMILSELKDACFDGKYDILNLMAAGAIIHDKGLLSALKVAEVHKSMALKKFEKYIVSYVAAGSLFRGDANPHDIDVYVVVDDTDVKKMSRIELKDKLRAIISGMGFDASAMTGVKAQFHVQTYILTDFWDNIKDANPVIFTFLRDGVPLFDRGVFMPWKLLLQMGKIKPSPEAIDLNMDLGERLILRVKDKLIGVLGEDLYYAALNPAQAALMLYGIPPPTPKETVKLLDEIFVKKEKLLEKKYVDILERVRKYFKDVEHGKIKEVKGKQIDEVVDSISDYLKRIKKLFNEIEKKSQDRVIINVYDASMAAIRDALYNETKKNYTNAQSLQAAFKEHLVETGKIPERFLVVFKDLVKAKKDYETKKLTRQEVDKVSKEARSLIRAITEYLQRSRAIELERARIRFKYGNKYGEVLLLDKEAFLIPDLEKREEIQKASLTSVGGLINYKKSSLEDYEKAIAKAQIPDKVFIKEKIFEDLKKIFGNDVEVLVSY